MSDFLMSDFFRLTGYVFFPSLHQIERADFFDAGRITIYQDHQKISRHTFYINSVCNTAFFTDILLSANSFAALIKFTNTGCGFSTVLFNSG
jgi:hypothetical protein